MAVLLGNFVVSGNYSRHLGYFDAPPGEPAIIEFEERLAARNDTVKVTPVALPFVYLRPETVAEYPGPGLKIHWIEVEGPFLESWPTESYRRVFGDVDPKSGTLADAERLLLELLPERSVVRWRRPKCSRSWHSSRSPRKWGIRLRRRCERASRRCWHHQTSSTSRTIRTARRTRVGVSALVFPLEHHAGRGALCAGSQW